MKTAALIIIGNEILSGRTQDANLSYLGKKLAECGIQFSEARVIPDIEQRIIDTVNDMRRTFDYVFTTGGIGPTHDDITAPCIAKAFGVDCIIDPEAKRRLEAFYKDRQDLNEARLQMARVPEGASLVDNPVSAAPGFMMENVITMAGVPRIMQAMLDFVLPMLEHGVPLEQRSVVLGVGEGTFAASLRALQEQHPDCDFGSYPFQSKGRFGTSIVVRGLNERGQLDAAFASLMKVLQDDDVPHEHNTGITALTEKEA